MFDLSGKVALITGGNSGIGLGMAEGLAKCGCDIVIWGRNVDKNAAAQESLSQYGVKVSTDICDVTDRTSVDAAFTKALKNHTRIDGCFANAGYGEQIKAFDEFEDEEWKNIIDINLNGTFYVFRNAARHMKERAKAGDPFGRLIATSSLAALSAQPKGQHYVASKGGLISMIKSLAIEYARYGVTAHSILPGFVETPLTGDFFEIPGFDKKIMPRIPVRRLGTGSDFKAIAAYIMSDASAWHTGQDFIIDGGYWLF